MAVAHNNGRAHKININCNRNCKVKELHILFMSSTSTMVCMSVLNFVMLRPRFKAKVSEKRIYNQTFIFTFYPLYELILVIEIKLT